MSQVSARLVWLKKEQREVRTDLRKAKQRNAWTAATSLRRHLAKLRRDYDDEVARLASLVEPEELTPEQAQAQLEREIANATEETLQACVAEWARRHGYKIAMDDLGEPQFIRRIA